MSFSGSRSCSPCLLILVAPRSGPPSVIPTRKHVIREVRLPLTQSRQHAVHTNFLTRNKKAEMRCCQVTASIHLLSTPAALASLTGRLVPKPVTKLEQRVASVKRHVLHLLL